MPDHREQYSEAQKKLFFLGISEALINELELTEDVYERLFVKLKSVYLHFYNKLIINNLWQLLLLTGRLEFYQSLQPDEQLRDNWNATIAHYAAWSGNIEALSWVHDKYPALFQIIDNQGRSIAHYAAWSGHTEVFIWVYDKFPALFQRIDNQDRSITHYAALSGHTKALHWVRDTYPQLLQKRDHSGRSIAHYAAMSGHIESINWVQAGYPALLQERDKFGVNIAHYAALSGAVEVLNWVEGSYPELVQEKTSIGRTIAHYAVLSGNIEVLDWICDRYSTLLKAKTKSGLSIVHYAGWLNRPRFFNNVLAISDTACVFDIPETAQYKDTMIDTLRIALNSNFSLLQVMLPESTSPEIAEEIAEKTARNEAIKKAYKNFFDFAEGYHQKAFPMCLLHLDVMKNIFKQCLPEGLPASYINEQFDRVMYESSPKGKACAKIKDIKVLVEAKIDEGRVEKILLVKLLAQLLSQSEEKGFNLSRLKTAVQDFYCQNYAEISYQRNILYSFFMRSQKTDTSVIFEDIASLIELELPTLSIEQLNQDRSKEENSVVASYPFQRLL